MPKDSVPAPRTDTLGRVAKTDTFQLKLSKDSLDAPVNFHAEDSMVFEVRTRRVIMFGKTDVRYKDINLTAPLITLDQSSQTVTARMQKDTAGTVVGMAKLTQGSMTTVSDSIRYNFKTEKGLIQSTFFQQDEIFNFAERVKKVDTSTLFAYKARFTTCNLDTPHFAFRAKKIKYVQGKVAITGPVHPEVEGIPIPAYLPFGFFPLKSGRASGLLAPQLTVTENLGLGLEGLGYYKVLNEYMDATFRADIYSYGSWRFSVSPTYRKRYKFNGNLSFNYQNIKTNFKGDPDFSQSRGWMLIWSHRTDSKARPGQLFGASVNIGSTQYLRNVPYGSLPVDNNVSGGYFSPINFTNQLQSSITYQKSWIGKPYNLSVSLNHNQNNQSRIVNLNLPDIGFTVNTLYPFQKKEPVGTPKWYEKLGIGYVGAARSLVSFYDSVASFGTILDTLQWGASHKIPITVALPQLGPLNIAPSISYEQRWYSQKFVRSWNDAAKKVDTTLTRGFFTAHDVSFGISMNTAIFGLKQFRKGSRIEAIRHVIRPNIGLAYKPDLMEPYRYTTQIDTLGRTAQFNVFDGSIFGAFGLGGRSGGISIGIDNNLEMKVRNRKDTSEDAKSRKIRLIDGFGVNTFYNLLADSFALSPFNFYLRSNLFEKINITASMGVNPYQYDTATGRPINRYAWQDGGFKVGRITNGSLNISTQLQSKKKDEDKPSADELREDDLTDLTMDQAYAQMDYIRNNPAEFADFNIPWSLSLGFSLSFAQVFERDYSGFRTELSSNLNFQGDFNLTPKWKFGAYGFYDFKTAKLQSFTTFVSREMHCWQLSVNVNFAGRYQFFNISFFPKSGLLRDLKINRTRQFYSN